MELSFGQELLIAVAAAVAGALATWLVPKLLKSPEEKRLEKVQRVTQREVDNSPVFQNLSGDQRIQVINYMASSTSANSQYIATGTGAPTVPNVHRWLETSSGNSGRRPLQKFTGTVTISQMSGYEVEVFYPAPFVRKPTLEVVPENGTARLTLTQRPDGFAAKADKYNARTDDGVTLRWTAEGELA